MQPLTVLLFDSSSMCSNISPIAMALMLVGPCVIGLSSIFEKENPYLLESASLSAQCDTRLGIDDSVLPTLLNIGHALRPPWDI